MKPYNQDSLEEAWVNGIELLEQGQYRAAIDCFEHVHLLYLAQGQVEEALPVMMKLIHLHLLLENWPVLQVYLQTVSDKLLKQQGDDSLINAEALLLAAQLVPNVGRYEDGERMALRALRLYEEQGNLKGICDVWLCLFGLYNSTGRYDSAGVYLRQANHLLQRFELGPFYQELILSSSSHRHWYQGDLTRALQCVMQAIELADANGLQKQQIRNRIVGGNIAQALGNLSEAQSLYLAAEQHARTSEFNRLLVEVYVHQTWLYILQERYGMARSLLSLAVQMSEGHPTIAISVRVVQSVLYSLTGRTTEATELLQYSLEYYVQMDNLLLVNTVRLHQAANWLRSKEFVQAADTLRSAFIWMAEQRIGYLPHWWHPPTMAMLCTFALQEGIQVNLAEQILFQHLGALAVGNVQELLDASDPQVQRRAEDALEILAGECHTVLTQAMDPPVRDTLAELLHTRRLLPHALARLADMLMTAEKRDKPNLALVAVFGLYVHGASRKQIADKLHLSPSTVRNYVNYIYKVFGLTYDATKQYDRYLQLRSQALTAGYIGEEVEAP